MEIAGLKKLAPWCAMLVVPQLWAAPTSVNTRAGIGANDFFDWSTIGVEYDYLGDSFGATGLFGLGATISGATESANGFERADQSSSWLGNFAPGDELLWTGFGTDPQVITISFATGVFGAGAQIQNDFPGPFDAFVKVYDTGGVLLYSDTFAGNSTPDADDSAIFVGVLNDVANIGKMEIGLVNDGLSFAINQLDVSRAILVPEASSYVALVGLVGLVGTRMLLRKRAGAVVSSGAQAA